MSASRIDLPKDLVPLQTVIELQGYALHVQGEFINTHNEKYFPCYLELTFNDKAINFYFDYNIKERAVTWSNFTKHPPRQVHSVELAISYLNEIAMPRIHEKIALMGKA